MDEQQSFKLTKELLELQNRTPRSKSKVQLRPNASTYSKTAIIQVLVTCKTTQFVVRDAMLVLASVSVMNTKQKAIQIYRLMKEITEELDNSLIIPSENDEDLKDELIGEQINRINKLHEVCSEMSGEQLDAFIEHGMMMLD